MPEAKGRREGAIRSRPRTKREAKPVEVSDEAATLQATFPPPSENGHVTAEETGFDEETNNRYEEIKRGGPHITELQQMTMQQLLRTAKDEGLSEYNGLKKQDLIFKILK